MASNGDDKVFQGERTSIRWQYFKKEGNQPACAVCWISPLVQITMPFENLKQGYYGMAEEHKRNQSILVTNQMPKDG